MTAVCPNCGRSFADDNAAYQHSKAKHSGKAARAFRQEVRRESRTEREPSAADELVDALLAAACGEDVPEHIELMFPDEIAEARRGR